MAFSAWCAKRGPYPSLSLGTPAWSLARQNFEVGYTLMQPHVVRAGIVTDEQWSVLWEQAQREFSAPDFGAVWQFVSVWGQKAVALIEAESAQEGKR
jgi:hypothetical protein